MVLFFLLLNIVACSNDQPESNGVLFITFEGDALFQVAFEFEILHQKIT